MSLLADLQNALEGKVEQQVDLSGRTSVRVGGAAEYLGVPQTEAALARTIDACVQHGVPYFVLGAGSNTLVSDAGVRGVVLRLGTKLVDEESDTERGTVTLKLAAGQPLSKLVSMARARACIGMEFLVGIPGTVGGAVVMNAGTKNGSTGQVCVEVGLCEPGRVRAIDAAEVGFEYRHTALPAHAVVSWAKFRLKVGDADDAQRSKQVMEDDLAYRRRTQPLNLPNSGSIFRNPPGGHAAQMIEACGLKGKQRGGAQISEVHANFIVNRGEARAADVLGLMREMQEAVLEKFAVVLVPEVKLVGEFDPRELPRGVGVEVPRVPAA